MSTFKNTTDEQKIAGNLIIHPGQTVTVEDDLDAQLGAVEGLEKTGETPEPVLARVRPRRDPFAGTPQGPVGPASAPVVEDGGKGDE